jgi:hypothetical protein
LFDAGGVGYHQSCTLTLSVNGHDLTGDVLGGPVLCEQSNPSDCYKPIQANCLAIRSVNVTFGSATLTSSVSTLGLSVNCPDTSNCTIKNSQLTGKSREITITNTGSDDATGVVVNHDGLPKDTSVSTFGCATIAAGGGKCVITIKPGATASTNGNDKLCTTGVHVTADGGLSVLVDTYVLSYGCIYQGGFIYSVDDTTTNTGSIGGKTAAITDTYKDQNSLSDRTPDWGGYGTDIGSSLYDDNIQGANEGSANSAAIISALTTNSVSLSDYAAGLCSSWSVDASGAPSCTALNTCYTNWYLPAICELGPYNNSLCTSGSTNIQQQLFENTSIPSTTLGLLNPGFYWSSTESQSSPKINARTEYFKINSSAYTTRNKLTLNRIRCSRALTF